jgi:hypothetical protein
MLSSIMAQLMSELWPKIMQAMAGDIPVPVRRNIVKLMDTAMIHLRNLFLPMLDSFLKMCCSVSVKWPSKLLYNNSNIC